MAPTPVGYADEISGSQKLVQFWEIIWGSFWSNVRFAMTRIEDSLVVLGCVLFAVGRSNATLVGLQSVVVSKWFCKGDECVTKEFVGFCVVGAATALFSRRGRATLAKSKQLFWEFDPTRGFAGQDTLTQ